jgi:putative Holliday junction resolvase
MGIGRILAIDYGLKRCGVAVTDPLAIIAQPHATVPTHQLMVWLQQYTTTETVQAIVVGWPTQTNGADSDTLPHVKGFLKRLADQFPAMKVHTLDERFTTKMAHQALRTTGANKQLRTNKGLADQVSAAIILQDWLQYHHA